jgi:hypothetical protein
VCARAILVRQLLPLAADASVWKLCHWHTFCVAELTAADDLTLIPFLRRADWEVTRGSERVEILGPSASPGGFVLRVIAGRDERLFDHFIMISPALPHGV